MQATLELWPSFGVGGGGSQAKLVALRSQGPRVGGTRAQLLGRGWGNVLQDTDVSSSDILEFYDYLNK